MTNMRYVLIFQWQTQHSEMSFSSEPGFSGGHLWTGAEFILISPICMWSNLRQKKCRRLGTINWDVSCVRVFEWGQPWCPVCPCEVVTKHRQVVVSATLARIPQPGCTEWQQKRHQTIWFFWYVLYLCISIICKICPKNWTILMKFECQLVAGFEGGLAALASCKDTSTPNSAQWVPDWPVGTLTNS